MNNKSSLIVILPNWIGDVLMALPTLRALHQQGIKLHLLGKPWVAMLLADEPFTVEVCEKNFTNRIKQLRKIDIKKVLILTNSLTPAMLCKLASKQSIGYCTDSRGILLSSGLKPDKSTHEIEYLWRLGQHTANYMGTAQPWPQQIDQYYYYNIPEKNKELAKQLLDKFNITEEYYLLNPSVTGTGVNHEPRNWQYWPQLCQKIHKSGYQIIACPGPNEELACRSALPRAKVLPNVDLITYAALMKTAKLLISNDSGPAHLADITGAHVLSVIGSTHVHRTRPWHGSTIGSKDHWPSLDDVMNKIMPL